ncbi:ABC-type multidrug transport system fused ATPase/permease subunit [Variovorax sp. SG517]|uniref:ABC transporter ATP-binding protein n=1 Tax=Variovorax sp. SG517 TaxID=2587117 RepID=UPI00159DAC95|nr:ABC transporter ATP-binding protein [Variovorax sp. SG517]NVM91550.1 ABC-type multidrug transport system fused ATPase/permease subunit [Variovorax sp. SG517]
MQAIDDEKTEKKSTKGTSPGAAVRQLYAALWHFAAGARAQLLSATALLAASQLIRLALPYLAGQAINALQRGELGTAGRWIAALAGVYVGAWALHGPGRILERNVGVKVREALADQLYARIAAAPLAWHEGHHSGELQHRVHQASRALSDFAQNQFIWLTNVVNFVGPLVALALLSRTSGMTALAGYVLIGLVIVRIDRALMKLARAENDADRRYVAALLDFLGNASTVIGLRLQGASRLLLRRRMAAISLPLKRAVVLNEGKWFAVDLMGLALTWGLVVIYVWQARAPGQVVMLGAVFMIHQYAQQAAGVVTSVAANFSFFARMHTDYGSAGPIWQAPSDKEALATPPGQVPAHERVEADASWRQLHIEALQWRYAPRGAPVDEAGIAEPTVRSGLHDVALTLRRGQRIALVGPSGGGKSTLLRVLAGLYAPGSGALLLDGQPADWARLRRLATLIPQETELFEASVRENLAFGQPHDDALLHAALHTSTFDEVLKATGGDLDTAVSERGFNLSGGQRQRLCLARGVLTAQGSSLLLLDEPTSALDANTEARVLERIAGAFPDACLIASVHRLSLLERFDTVVLMEAGHVLDHGPFEEVLARQPLLRHMTAGSAPAQAAQQEAET